MQIDQQANEYIPGKCNIGAAEINRRYRIGYIGLVLMIFYIIISEIFSFPQLTKLILFAPAAYSLSGFLQARQKFCFLYGYMGVFSMSGRRKLSKVKDSHELRKDRTMAIRIIAQVILGSSLITLIYYFLS